VFLLFFFLPSKSSEDDGSSPALAVAAGFGV
jgi:hypothetical protein